MVVSLKYINLCYCLVFLFWGCEVIDDTPYVFETIEDQMVVYAWITPENVKAFVGHTQNLNEEVYTGTLERDTIADALVLLMNEAGDIQGSIPYKGKGNYQLDVALEEGMSYKLIVEKEGYRKIESEAVMLPYKEFRASISRLKNGPYVGSWAVDLALRDEERDDVYVINWLNSVRDSFPFTNYRVLEREFGDDYFYINTWVNLAEGYVQHCSLNAWGMLDECFNGNTIDLPLVFDFSDLDIFEENQHYLEVSTVSRDYFEYAQSQVQPEIIIEHIFDTPRVEVSNVQGGLGFVAAKNSMLFPLEW